MTLKPQLTIHPRCLKDDIPHVTPMMDRMMVAFFTRLVNGNIKMDDVLLQEGYTDTYRWKPDKAIRRSCDGAEFRVVYRYTGGTKVELLVVADREFVYKVWGKHKRDYTK